MSVVRDLLPQSVSRRQGLTFAFLLAGMIAAYMLAGYIVANDLQSLLFAAVIVIIAGAVVALLHNWRNGLYLFLAWLLFEDLPRKFSGNNMAVYLAKDLLVLFVYLSFFAAYRRKEKDLQTFRPPFLLPLSILFWFGFAQMFNPASGSIWYGPLGMKLYFYYVPLLFVGYALITSEAELRRFFHINLALMLVIAALGIAQSIAGPRFLNPTELAPDIRALGETYRVAPISGARTYRPTSVFVSTSRFSDLLVVAWLLALAFAGYLLLRRRRGRNFALLSLIVIAAACVMSTSRGVFMWSFGGAIICAGGFLWGAPWRQGEALRVLRALQRVVLGVVFAAVIMLFIYPQEFLDRVAVYSETLDPRSPSSELLHRSRDYPLQNFLAAFDFPRWPYGYGIGTLSLGGQYIAKFFHTQPSAGGVESGFGCIVIEMGILGLCFWIFLAVAIGVSAWKVVRSLRGSPFFPIAFMILLYAMTLLLPMTFASMNSYQDFVLNAYLWLLLGILFRLPTLPVSATYASDLAPVRPAPPSA